MEDKDMLFESGTDVLILKENDHNDKLQHSNTNEIKDMKDFSYNPRISAKGKFKFFFYKFSDFYGSFLSKI